MSSYEDGPDEPEESFQPPEPSEKPVLELKVSNYELGNMINHALAYAMEKHVKASIEKFVEKKVSKAVDALVKEISAETIKAHVEKVLTEGWGKVNEWGEQRGEKVTLSSVVRDGLFAMSKVPERSYHDKATPSPIGAIVQEMAADAVKNGLQPILDEAKAQLRTTLDVQLGKGLRLTLADALKG